MRVLMITSEWPSDEHPNAVPFIIRQVNFLRKAGISVEVFHFRGNKNPINYAKAWMKVQSLLSKNTFDLIHAQWGQSALLMLPSKIPLVVTFRGSDVMGIIEQNGKYTLIGSILRAASFLVAKYAKKVILVSEHLSGHLPLRSYTVIPSGLDLELFRPMNKLKVRRSLNLPSDSKIVFFGGSPSVARKRYSLANTAFKRIEYEFPGIQMLVAEGIQHSKMPLYMNASDVLLLTSMHEGSPNVIKEALACNLPIVSTDVGDVRKRIDKIDGCFVCEDDDPETIANDLERALKKEARIEGRDEVLDLDEKILTKKLITVYHQALSIN